MQDTLQNDVDLAQLQGQKNKTDSEEVRTKRFAHTKKKKVIIGDSHGRGCATEVTNYLRKT